MHREIEALCRRTDRALWSAFHTPFTGAPESRLSFPETRVNGEPRVSEQEARFAFVEALQESPFRYQVEAPTRKLYGFSGGGKRAAQTDLVLLDADGRPLCNVEFKANGASLKARTQERIHKDLQKLLREDREGLWFHLLKGVDSGTLPKLVRVMTDGLAQVRGSFDDLESPAITLHLCVLEKRFSLHTQLRLRGSEAPPAEALSELLGRGLDAILDGSADAGPWSVNRPVVRPSQPAAAG